MKATNVNLGYSPTRDDCLVCGIVNDLFSFCRSLLEDVEQPLKQVLSYEDEDTAAKRKLIVLEQRVKRKLKMKFAGLVIDRSQDLLNLFSFGPLSLVDIKLLDTHAHLLFLVNTHG